MWSGDKSFGEGTLELLSNGLLPLAEGLSNAILGKDNPISKGIDAISKFGRTIGDWTGLNALYSMMGAWVTGLTGKERSPEAQREKKGLSGLLDRLGPGVQRVIGGAVAGLMFNFNPLIGALIGVVRGALPKFNPRGMFGKGGSGADSLGGRGVEGVPAFTNFGRYADRMDATKFSVEGVPRFVGTGGVQSHPFAIGAQPEPEKKRGFLFRSWRLVQRDIWKKG